MVQTETALALPLVAPHTSVRDTMLVIDKYAKGIAVVVDDERRLVATITDGDIRRAILAGIDFGVPVMHLKQRQSSGPERVPVTARVGATETELIALMKERSVPQIPLLDAERRVCGLAVLHDLLHRLDLPVTGVIMAGGFGKRLSPLTDSVPKPMLPINGRPLMEHTLDKFRQAGVQSVHITTHYLSDSITRHFKDGAGFGVNLTYVQESEPLGTAAALAQIKAGTDPLLVMNGDILTNVNLRAMLDFHREHGACLTVGVRQYDIEVPFGVVESDGIKVLAVTEKPVLRHFINAGIYMVEPAVCRLIPPKQHFDMPDLITAAIQQGGTVISFPVSEYWLDIGRIEQYQKAGADAAEGIV